MSRSLGLATALLLAVAVPGAVIAQGFSVNEHGSCVMGRGGTGVALPCDDGSTVLFNPSGFAGTTGWTLSGGVTLIKAMGSFTDDLTQQQTELQNELVPVPHAYLTYGINQQWAAGFGFFVPYGLGTEWPATFDGRFQGYDNSLHTMYFQPTVAWQPHPSIKLGAGFDFVVGSLKLTQRADLSEFDTGAGLTFGQIGIPHHTDFANGKLEASGATGFGGNFGVTWDATAWLSLGARYMTLTWSNGTRWADSSGDTALWGGLTDFGREVVLEMNRLGMMVDVSHVSDDTFRDVMQVSKAPVIASHSSVRVIR